MNASRALAHGSRGGFRLLWTALVIIPFVVMISLSFRSMTDIYENSLGLSGKWLPSNFDVAWHGPAGGVGFSSYLLNSAIVGFVAVTIAGAFGSLAAYFTSLLPPKQRKRAMAVPLLAAIVPGIALLIPLFQAFNALNLLSRPVALGVVYAGLCLPTTVLLLNAFFVDFPAEMREASALDGLGRFGTFLRIVLPLSYAPLGAVTILNLIWIWGETQIALVLLQSQSSQTIPVGLLSFQGQFLSDLGPLFAGLTMATIPILVLYLFFHRFINKGVTLGGFK